MKKIKTIFMSLLAVVTLGVVSLSANAESSYTETGYGQYNVTTTTNDNDTATWDFTQNVPSSNVYSGAVSGNYNAFKGIISSSTNRITYKYSEKALNIPKTNNDVHSNVLIPVPSVDAAGTIYFTGTGNNDSRILTLMDSTATATTTTYTYNKTETGINFTANEVTTFEGSYYVRFDSIQESGDIKLSKIKVVLTSGAYEASAAIYEVTIYDGSSVLTTTEVAEGGKVNCVIGKWGYDLEGLYTDSEFTQEFDVTTDTVTSELSLYAKFVAWEGVISSPYCLDSNLISKASSAYGSFTATTPLEGTIYSILSGASATETYISTGGGVSTSEKGVKIDAPAGGYVKVTIGVGGNSARNAKFIDANSTGITAVSGTVEFDGTTYAANEIVYPVTAAGEYYVGGTSGMRIYSLEFIPQVELQWQASQSDATQIRLVGTIRGLDSDNIAEATAKVDLVLDDTNAADSISVDTVYTSITDVKEEAEGVYYFVVLLNLEGMESTSHIDATLTVVIDGVTYTATSSAITVA